MITLDSKLKNEGKRVMKRIISLLLLLALVFALAACGDYAGLSISIDSVFPDGFSLELKNGGKATFHFEGKDYGMKWTLDGTTFHAEGGGAELDGTLSDGVMNLINVLDSGVNINLVRAQ